MDAGEVPGSSRVPWPATLAVAVGLAARLVLCFRKPLWADEIFTLTVAREPISRIVEALRLDSGPPLHYLLAKLALLPFVAPGPADVAVRLVSLVAAILHVPLILAVGRRGGRTSSAWGAAALFALSPVAVAFGAEGRGYAVASLLLLAAFERSLALEDRPTRATAVVAGTCGALAVLTHYLALFPLAGMALAFCRGRAWRLHLLSGGVAALVAFPWLPIALGQPRAAMAWASGFPAAGDVPRAAAAILLGIDAGGAVAPFLSAAGLVLLVLFVVEARRGGRAAGTVLAGGALFLLAGLALPEILLPERGAAAFVPLSALALGRRGGAALVAACVAVAGFLAAQVPTWVMRSPGEDLASHLAAPVMRGARVAATGLWGPELAYRMASVGRPGAVVLFPSDVARHPGWYAEGEVPRERMADEARELLSSPRPPDLYVLARGSAAAEVLRTEVVGAGAEVIGQTPLLEVFRRGRRAERPPKGER